jgi:hypothetical protein
MRGVGRHVDGLAGPGDHVFAAEGDRYLAVEHGEHFLEVMAVRRGTAARRDVHVDEGVPAIGVVAGDQDRVRVADQSQVRKRLVLIRPGDRQVVLPAQRVR